MCTGGQLLLSRRNVMSKSTSTEALWTMWLTGTVTRLSIFLAVRIRHLIMRKWERSCGLMKVSLEQLLSSLSLQMQCESQPWLFSDSFAYEKLCEVLLATRTVNEIRMMSGSDQTSHLESFHALVNRFCPKMIHFGYYSMEARYPACKTCFYHHQVLY